MKEGARIPGASSSRYTVEAVAADNAANFTVAITDAYGGSVISTSAALTVSPGTFVATSGPMTTPRMFHTATLLSNGKVLVVGGISLEASGTAELFDPGSGNFLRISTPLIHPRYGHTATLLASGKVLLAGGLSPGTNPVPTVLAKAELFDPVTESFAETASLPSPRSGHAAIRLPNGKVLLAGGGDVSVLLPNADLFDPVSGSFTATGPLVVPRGAHAVTLLPDGRALLVGGYVPAGGKYLASAEVFDPTTGAFTATSGNLLVGRYRLVATPVPDGRVLVAGGTASNGVTVGTTELFEPVTGAFKLLADNPLPNPSKDHTSTLLPNGYVLIVGDNPGSGGHLFDPATGTYIPTNGVQGTARSGNTMTLLADGKVLLAGGFNQAALGSAELYW